jgi:hypothetical protein
MPRWTFENKITFGNILTIVVTLGGLLAGYMTLVGTVGASAEAVKALPGLETRVTTIETRINIGQQQREKFQDQVLATLSQLQQQNLETQKALARLEAKLP